MFNYEHAAASRTHASRTETGRKVWAMQCQSLRYRARARIHRDRIISRFVQSRYISRAKIPRKINLSRNISARYSFAPVNPDTISQRNCLSAAQHFTFIINSNYVSPTARNSSSPGKFRFNERNS